MPPNSQSIRNLFYLFYCLSVVFGNDEGNVRQGWIGGSSTFLAPIEKGLEQLASESQGFLVSEKQQRILSKDACGSAEGFAETI
mmetsp:Transcript_9472/g.35165  ORF Transcript_9472/g.35165 Transcript_9472/m.35165 type:complete len:84 (-) Transcript_9472:3701-3952(-)